MTASRPTPTRPQRSTCEHETHLLCMKCTQEPLPRRRFLDDLDLPEARARILLALSVLQHGEPSPAVERACRCLRGEVAL